MEEQLSKRGKERERLEPESGKIQKIYGLYGTEGGIFLPSFKTGL